MTESQNMSRKLFGPVDILAERVYVEISGAWDIDQLCHGHGIICNCASLRDEKRQRCHATRAQILEARRDCNVK